MRKPKNDFDPPSQSTTVFKSTYLSSSKLIKVASLKTEPGSVVLPMP